MKYVKIAKQMVTIHVKLVHVAYHQHTKPSHLFVCPCVATLHKIKKSKKEDLLAATFSCCCWKCCCHPCCFLGEGPSPSATLSFVLLLCGKSLFSLFWKRMGSRREKEKALNLVFLFFSFLETCFPFPSLNLRERERERERDTHTHTHTHTHICFGPIL